MQLGLVWFIVAISIVKGFPTVDAIEKIASLAKNLGCRSGREINATQIIDTTLVRDVFPQSVNIRLTKREFPYNGIL